jgi:hypothetical protein
MSSTSTDRRSGEGPHRAGAFDIRTFIALLIGLFGIVCVLSGLFGTSDEELTRADGLNINLWAGTGMIVVAAAMQAWAMLRPVVVPPHLEAADAPQQEPPRRPGA